MTTPTDQQLAARALEGDQNAFGKLVLRYQKSVFNVCYRILGIRQDAEDLTQEAFLRAHRKLSLYDPTRPFGPWIRVLAANLCRNSFSGQPPPAVPLLDEHDHPGREIRRGPERALELSEDHREMYRALWQLPTHHRLAVELRHFQGLSYQDMAEALDLPLNTVRSHLYRGRQKLAQLLKNHEST